MIPNGKALVICSRLRCKWLYLAGINIPSFLICASSSVCRTLAREEKGGSSNSVIKHKFSRIKKKSKIFVLINCQVNEFPEQFLISILTYS